MPALPTESNIGMTGSGVIGKAASGVGMSGLLSPSDQRTMLSVYTASQTDSAISAAIAAILDSSPAALDTLNELAAALGDDANFATTVTNALAGKAASSHSHVISDITGLGWSYVTGTDAATAMAVNTWYNVDMSGWTSDRIYSLPSTAAVGDRVAVYISAGDDAFEMDLRTTSGSSDTINGVDRSSSSWSRLFITGELVIFECTVANTNWVVVRDGRIKCQVIMARTTAKTGNTNSTSVEVNGYATPSVNIGDIANNSTGRITLRRDNRIQVGCGARLAYTAGANVSDGSLMLYGVRVNGAVDARFYDMGISAGIAMLPLLALSEVVDVVNGEYVSAWAFMTYNGGSGAYEIGKDSWNMARLHLVEVLR